jgi:type IV pilus assembly protein PilM
MPTPLIGLDIGSSAVRAVELERCRAGVALKAFGQVGLPRGAVVDGEVVDTDAVSQAIRRLWHDAGISARQVVVGVGGQRVILREAEVPGMPAADFRSALRFQAGDLIPLPVEDTELDFTLLRPPDATGGTMLVLLAAAHRDVVAGVIAATEGAGLTVEGVDVAAAATMRAARGVPAPPPGEGDGCDAVVSIGAHLTTVTVSEGRSSWFARTIAGGGAAVTAAAVADADATWETIEAAKRHATWRTTALLESTTQALVTEIASSLNFVLAQKPELRLRRVLVTGGGSVQAGCVEALARELEVAVECADGFAHIDTAAFSDQPGLLRSASPVVLTAAGLALWPLEAAGERLSLLPETITRRRALHRDLRRSGLAVVGVAAVLGALWFAQEQRVSDARAQARSITSAAALAQARVDRLAPIQTFFDRVDGRILADKQALAGSVDWRAVIAQIAKVMPAGSNLTGFEVAAATPAAGSTTTPTTPGAPSSAVVTPAESTVTMNVVATGGVSQVAAWLDAMRKVPSLADAWVPSSSVTTASAHSVETVSFTCTASVTRDAPLQHPSLGGQP